MRMYYSADEAVGELEKRQADHNLITHIEEWRNAHGIVLPQIDAIGRLAFFARQIATCRYEDIVFQNIAHAAGLTPIWIEFTEDKFVASSPYKRSLASVLLCW